MSSKALKILVTIGVLVLALSVEGAMALLQKRLDPLRVVLAR